ncbi:MAG: trimethylamine methyltransferase family protein, partial [Gammaproteobacteria bacterium]
MRPGSRSRRTGGARLPQLPWTRVVNPYAPMEILSADQIEAIHLTSLRILEEIGIELMSPAARAAMRAVGAEVDEATGTVRLDRAVVERALATTPERFTLTSRNPAKQLQMGGRDMAFGLVAGPPFVHDCERGRRAGNLADYRDFIKLAQHFNAIHIIGNQVCAPIELPANSRHLDTYRTNLVYSDLSFHCTAIGAGRARDGIEMMAITRGLTPEQMADSPGVLTIISVNSPRRFDEAMADGLMEMARFGQPVVITPFALMGAMAPVSLAAALAQQNAEILFGLTLAQAVRPGTPVMYG